MILSLLFFIVAVIYSIAGFGGGSSYSALLTLFNFPYQWVPVITLMCNITVVSSGLYNHFKGKWFNFQITWPFIVSSIPFSYLGGRLEISKVYFHSVLGVALLLAAIKMIFFKKPNDYQSSLSQPFPLKRSLFIGAILGFVSGLAGVGGGIFLAPIMYNLKLGEPKNIAAACALFIWVNSMAGLLGQINKFTTLSWLGDHYLLILAVLIGGIIGSHLGVFRLKSRHVEVVTALILVIVSIRLLWNLILG